MTNESVYYRHSAKRLGLASQISFVVRQRIFERFMQIIRPSSEHSVLDIGVTSDTEFRESNYFEQFYPFKERITCVGTENGEHLEQRYPGLKFFLVQAGQPLPFSDKQFDVVFSNAVVEHVGGEQDQQNFVEEAMRVGRRVFITTPNRWFPIEHHTSIPLLHYLPKPVYRDILRRTSLNYWSFEKHLNLLTLREFKLIFRAHISVERIGIGIGPFKSNLIAYTVR